ncbi:serine hydrolase domain-containing protein [Solimonas terrae]|uniref:Beta-lactamase family protein n=1 Tax=Solimonas terrae TaxID=1396819 RepID=A0A6M2BTS3_9GAMM|nr:serine hydrolase domain-containing protein [Solimonas terrae]NGY05740.1 beta-lactamase family protein [Solimonas terrae]
MQLSLPRVPLAAPALDAVGRCLWTSVRVPDDLTAVTRVDRAAEVDPREADMSVAGRERIWAAVEHLFRGGVHPAITMEIRRRGKIVLKRSIGCVHGNLPGDTETPVVITPDSPVSLFSASKSISSLLIHKLVDDGVLSLDDRVVDYIPEFAPHGKDRITIRGLLAHRAGIPDVPHVEPTPQLLHEWDRIIELLCAAKPFDPDFSKQAYHALTAGFIIGEIVRRASGRELPDVLHDWIARPLKLRYMTFGLAPELRHLAPVNARTGPRPFWPANQYIKRVVGVPMQAAVRASNDEAFLSQVVPAGNIYASADDSCRVFQMLLNGGELDGVRIFKPETVADAIRPVGPLQLDRKLLLPMRYSPGFMLGQNPVGLYGPGSGAAFGHLGFLTVLCWADPARDISVSLLNTGKALAPAAFTRIIGVLLAVADACPRVA